MIEAIVVAVALAGAGLACWYCYRWGFADGRAEGFADGNASEPQGGGGPKPEK